MLKNLPIMLCYATQPKMYQLCSTNANEFRANACVLRANSRNNSLSFCARSREIAQNCVNLHGENSVSLQRWHGKIYLHLRKERQPVLAKPYRGESRAFSSKSRQTACTRTVGISREIVRLATLLREDTRSRGFARDSRSRILSRANAINNFGRASSIMLIKLSQNSFPAETVII